MAKMFTDRTDQNGVTVSSNAHPASEFGPAPSSLRPGPPHLMQSDTAGGYYIERGDLNIVHETKDRVLRRIGHPGAMEFEGDLLPREDRLAMSEGRQTTDQAAGENAFSPCCQPSPSQPPTRKGRR